jgi:pSer/pThr/pTyr-binding forkhead associated (FHA) protein
MNGTYVNGQRIEPHVRHPLMLDDQVQVADTVLVLEDAEETGLGTDGLPYLIDSGITPERGLHPLLMGMLVVAVVLIIIVVVLAVLVLT